MLDGQYRPSNGMHLNGDSMESPDESRKCFFFLFLSSTWPLVLYPPYRGLSRVYTSTALKGCVKRGRSTDT